MKNITDRIVEHPNRYRLVPVPGQDGVYDLELVLGTITAVGTPINRALLMAMQGFVGQTTVFNADGSITQTNEDGHTLTTVFNADGSINEVFSNGAQEIGKKTIFNEDGSIAEQIL